MWSKTEGLPSAAWAILLGATFVAAAMLRLVGLDSSLWYDEIVTLVVSARLPVSQIVTVYPDTNVHPLYSLLSHASLVVFGESAWALRLPAALAGIASVVMAYVLGARLMSRPAAWAAAAVLATSYHHIWFSQNARGYTLMGCLALISTWALHRAARNGRWPDYATYAVASAAGVYAHLTMAFVVAGQAAALVVARGLRWPALQQVPIGPAAAATLGAAVASALAYAPYGADLMSNLAGPAAPQRAAEVATTGWAAAEAVRTLLSGSGALAAAAGAAVAATGAWALWRKEPLAVALLILPAAVTFAAILVLGQPVRPRFFFFLSGAAALFVGRGLDVVAGALVGFRPQWRSSATVAATLLLVAASLPLLPRNYRVPKQDFDGVVAYLESAERAGVAIAVAEPACMPIERYYRKTWPCLAAEADWPARRPGGARVAVAFTLVDYVGDPGLRQRLRACDVERRFAGTLGGGDFTVCEVRP